MPTTTTSRGRSAGRTHEGERGILPVDVEIRPGRPGDGAGIARCHLGSARGYVEQDPELFRMPDEEGLVEWLEADLAEDHRDSVLSLVAEAGGEIAGHL